MYDCAFEQGKSAIAQITAHGRNTDEAAALLAK